MSQYDDQTHGLPSDFPGDPVVNHDPWIWGFLTLFVVVVACVAMFCYFKGLREASKRLDKAIVLRAKLVRRMLGESAVAPGAQQMARAKAAEAEISKHFHHTLALAAKLNKPLGGIAKALDGTKEEDAAKGGVGGGTAMAGSTIINIAVNQGGPVVGDGAAAGVAPGPYAAPLPAEDKPITPDQKSESVWRATQKIFDYWKNLLVVVTAFRAAQTQLVSQPFWERPREQDRFDGDKHKRPSAW